MIVAHEDVELAVRLPADRDSKVDVLSRLAAQRIGVTSFASYQERDRFILLLIAEDPRRAQEVLAQAGYSCKSDAVVLVDVAPEQITQLAQIGHCLHQAGVSILSSHVAPHKPGNLCAVFHTSDNHHALQILTQAA